LQPKPTIQEPEFAKNNEAIPSYKNENNISASLVKKTETPGSGRIYCFISSAATDQNTIADTTAVLKNSIIENHPEPQQRRIHSTIQILHLYQMLSKRRQLILLIQ